MAHLIEIFKWWLYIFVKSAIYMKVALIAFFILCFFIVLWIINIPIYNFIVIPIVERRLGRKLEFLLNSYSCFPFGKFLMKHGEVAKYIVRQYFSWKFKNNKKIIMSNVYALQRAGYKIEDASRFEIFMSFFIVIDYLIIILSLATTTAIALIFGSH